MKAAQIEEYGDASVIRINEIDKPKVNPDQVLVKVFAASLNPFDTTLRSGKMKKMIPLKFPATLGGDFAGEVVKVGKDVENFAAGDKVFGQALIIAGGSGAFAEFASAKASSIAKMPDILEFNRAASLPLVGVSAVEVINHHIGIKKDQKIFIHGGAGGIGSIAIQVAKYIGAYVATTATDSGLELVLKLGADEVIDYKTEDFTKVLKDYDAIFDCVGGEDFDKSLAILKKGGVAVSMLAKADEQITEKLGIKAITQNTRVSTELLNKVSKLVETGVITPNVGKVFNINQVSEAFEARESGKITGKIVLEIK